MYMLRYFCARCFEETVQVPDQAVLVFCDVDGVWSCDGMGDIKMEQENSNKGKPRPGRSVCHVLAPFIPNTT